MRIGFTTALLAVAVTAAGCSEQSRSPAAPESISVPVRVDASHGAGHTHRFGTHMSGGQEVPSNDSRAQGQSNFKLSADGTSLSYKLIVANIQNVTMSHIHLAPAGSNGPVVAWLYPSGPPPQLIPGRSQGVLAEGVITASSLVGLLAGASLQDLVDEMIAGNTYVNVHTSQFPPGEVRGQIR